MDTLYIENNDFQSLQSSFPGAFFLTTFLTTFLVGALLISSSGFGVDISYLAGPLVLLLDTTSSSSATALLSLPAY